jgi:hypothetical protein
MAPIHNAVRNGNLNLLRALLNSGANINTRDDDEGGTALIHAASYGRLPLVKLLLNRGANVNARDNEGESALMSAAYIGETEIVRELLNRGANINARDISRESALMHVAYSGHLPVVRLLLKRGANTKGILNNPRMRANVKNAIMKHKAGLTIQNYKKASNMRRRAASAKALNNVRTPNGRPLPPNSIRSIMSMLKPRSPK